MWRRAGALPREAEGLTIDTWSLLIRRLSARVAHTIHVCEQTLIVLYVLTISVGCFYTLEQRRLVFRKHTHTGIQANTRRISASLLNL